MDFALRAGGPVSAFAPGARGPLATRERVAPRLLYGPPSNFITTNGDTEPRRGDVRSRRIRGSARLPRAPRSAGRARPSGGGDADGGPGGGGAGRGAGPDREVRCLPAQEGREEGLRGHRGRRRARAPGQGGPRPGPLAAQARLRRRGAGGDGLRGGRHTTPR